MKAIAKVNTITRVKEVTEVASVDVHLSLTHFESQLIRNLMNRLASCEPITEVRIMSRAIMEAIDSAPREEIR